MKASAESRNNKKINFLIDYFSCNEFKIQPLQADASFRTYDRVIFKNKSFILMDSPVIHYSLAPFIKIAKFLNDNKFSAPKIYKEDHANGFLLLEDFGLVNIRTYLFEKQDNHLTEQIYKKSLDLLVELQSITPPADLQLYDTKFFLKELELYLDWYVLYKCGKALVEKQKEEFLNLWTSIFKKLPTVKHCLVLRDYHVENMMLLDRIGINSIGLLDFQDAVVGHPIYDVVSILEDARIEVSRELSLILFNYYLRKKTDISQADGVISYHILAAQRNLRILGVFARKSIRDNQENYLKYIPRVLKYLEFDLSHVALLPVKKWIEDNL